MQHQLKRHSVWLYAVRFIVHTPCTIIFITEGDFLLFPAELTAKVLQLLHEESGTETSTKVLALACEHKDSYKNLSDDEAVKYIYNICTARYVKSSETYTVGDYILPNCNCWLLVEDTNSGLYFWKQIIDTCSLKLNVGNPVTFKDKPTGGITYLAECVEEIEQDDGQQYFILYDDDPLNSSLTYKTASDRIKEACKSKRNCTLLSNYVGFETLFIGCKIIQKIYNALSRKANDYLEEISAVQQFLFYNNLTDALKQLQIKYAKDSVKNRYMHPQYSFSALYDTLALDGQLPGVEKVCEHILLELSSHNDNKVSKKEIGNCLWLSCGECNKCILKTILPTNKLLIILENSYYNDHYRRDICDKSL